MNRSTLLVLLCSIFFIGAVIGSCKGKARVGEVEIAEDTSDINDLATGVIQATLEELQATGKAEGKLPALRSVPLVKKVYAHFSYRPIWTNNGEWKPMADSLLAFIDSSRQYGLFPGDYYGNKLAGLRQRLVEDTTAGAVTKLNASLWAEADLWLTTAFVRLTKDLRAGRLFPDSILLQRDSVLRDNFFTGQVTALQQGASMQQVAESSEPEHPGYHQVKAYLQDFLPGANLRKYTYVNPKDSARLPARLRKRLGEEASVVLHKKGTDSLVLADAIRQYQKSKGLKPDGKISAALVTELNNNDRDRFIRLAIALDRYKGLPRTMPDQYIWVNIPSYRMQVRAGDSVLLESKVVVGTPKTRTPELTSAISDMVTYPKWTIPPSIIKKDIIPGMKRNPGYIYRKGFSLVDNEGKPVDPYGVNWAKYHNSIPYKVVQGSGDDNALGVMKFNFSNDHSVYLHDTNQRYLFSKKSRALSHGCVRVEQWDALAYYILRQDSTLREENAISPKAVPADSLRSWLAQKKKKYIRVRGNIPLFIRYFTCDVINGKLVFYEDVYGEDRRLQEKYFVQKN
ncbi:L,D-transpeptidase family protein [Paraflavisolibacter sp. H34]|uniref:L,D-transpeptidase family protein n=1 Tax=Huijunlia imazamoxiresistens TaxID=3127457 RepID=UPI0030172B99